MKQQERILNYMIKHGGITAAEAFRDLGVMRLSARIKDLKESGYDITHTDIDGENRYGEKVRYRRYKVSTWQKKESL